MKSHPAAEQFPQVFGAELEQLAEDIRRNGLRHPIVTHKGLILDGRSRFAACALAGIKPRYVEWDGQGGSPVAYVISVNIHRRHLDASQRAFLVAALVPMLAAETEARRASKLKKGSVPVRANLPEREIGRARDQAAAIGRVSPRSVEHAVAVRERGVPELQDAVLHGQVAVSDAAGILDLPAGQQQELLAAVKAKRASTLAKAARTVAREALLISVRAEPTPPPEGPFRVIVAAPRESWSETDDDLGALGQQVVSRAHADAVLVLQMDPTDVATGRAAAVARAWGFRPLVLVTWARDEPGPGHFLRAGADHCLLAVRGNPVVYLQDETTLLQVKTGGRLPAELFELLERVYPGPKLQVFGTEPREGWADWYPERPVARPAGGAGALEASA